MMMNRDIFEREEVRAKNTERTLKRLGHYFAPYRNALWLVLVLTIITTVLQILPPLVIGQAIDCYIAPDFEGVGSTCRLVDNPTEANLTALSGAMIFLIVLTILSAASNAVLFYTMAKTGQQVLTELRNDIFDHIHRLSLKHYDRNPAGDTMSRLTNDSDQIATAVNFSLVRVSSQVLVLVGSIAIMFVMHPPLALISTSVVPVMLLATVLFSRAARRAFRQTRTEMGEVNADLQESIAGVRESQAFNRENENIERFKEVNASNRDANIRAVSILMALRPVLSILGVVAQAIIIGVGSLWAIRGEAVWGYPVSIGLMVAFLVYIQRLYEPVQIVGQLWAQIQAALAGAERMFNLLDEAPDILDAPNAIELPAIQGNIAFEKVSFAYNPTEPVLREVSFTITAGQTVAIVGPTGAGKTSIINLIGRFYDVTGGKVTVDGYDIREVTQASLRRQMGVVLQDNFLWSATILENIRYGRLDASDEEVFAAAKLARAHDFILALPEGYQTLLGERGRGLSQGQRQLIAIARAALSNPRILILDEATSSVDTRTERLIQSALEDLMQARTSVVIAHRLSTIRHADVVLVIKDGQIVEQGTHDTLLAQQGEYHNIYMSQFRHEEIMLNP